MSPRQIVCNVVTCVALGASLPAAAHPGSHTPAVPAAQVPAALDDAALLELADAVAAETIVIDDDAPAESASSVRLAREQLDRRARTQMSDVLRQVPGLMVSQHAGGGKADQYLIRGFDADHGTDIAVFADGVPVNLVSHGHGQGFADTHWLIPEAIASVNMHKGPYAARYGDFYTAGALELRTLDRIDAPTLWISGGAPLGGPRRFASIDRRMVGMASPTLRDDANDRSLLAVEVGEADGPFINAQGFRRAIAMGRWQGELGPGNLELATNWYQARWNQSGQLPASLVASGELDRFGAIDPSEGGAATRASVKLGYELPAAGGKLRAFGYGVYNKFDLFSNFTLYARDPTRGDAIEQTDDRVLYGLDAAYQRTLRHGSVTTFLTAGVQARADDVQTSLWHVERRRRVGGCFAGTNPCNLHDSAIRNVAAYAEAKVVPAAWLDLLPGVRVDRLSWQVTDLAAASASDPMLGARGFAARTIASPKLSAVVKPTEQVQLFANSGGGFHSNDARSAVERRGHGAIARAWGGEIGARVKPAPATRVSFDVWYLRLSSEQVWSGDAGGTEPSDPTRRFGMDVEAATELAPWLSLDANLSFAQARSLAGGAVPLAPRWMGSGGLTAKRGHSFVALRCRGIADRPGNEDGSLIAEGYVIFDLIAATRRGRWGINLTVQNLLDAEWREAQFAEASRVAPMAEVVEQMHFTPGIPLTVTAAVSFSH
jgi:outer membrane receptor protein involved in Fe transport